MKKIILISFLVLVSVAVKSQNWPYVVPNQDYKVFYSQRDVASNVPSAIDVNNSVFTTGFKGLASSSADLLVLKYDSLGTQSYQYTYNNGGYDNGNAICINSITGVAYIAGVSFGTTTGNDYVIIKLNQNGSLAWLKRFDRGAGAGIDEATAVCYDMSGNVYVTGKSKNSGGTFDIVTLKLNGGTGATIWQHVFNSTSNLDDVGTGMVLSTNNSVLYISGNSDNSSTGTDIVTYALNTGTGAYVWAPVFANGTANSTDKSNGIIYDGNVVVICGEILNGSTGLDYTTIAYNSASGALAWQNNYNFGGTERATALVKDSAGNIGVVGTVLNGTSYSYHTVLYNSSGTQYAVNIENTGLGTLLGDPQIANDTIAHHWYVSGEKQAATRDLFAYQITPTGNTSWRQVIDGQGAADGAPGVAVNGVGVVYLVGLSTNQYSKYDFMTVKINQTPVYFPPNLATEAPLINHLYYENKGQIMRPDSMVPVKDILFSTLDYYPYTFFKTNRISYKFERVDTLNTKDTTQRIDITMIGANPLAAAYPFNPKHGEVSYMIDGMANAVTGIQGYERYFIPNIYPSIDLHYYSNGSGMKMYYVLKPFANPKNIQWRIDGSTSNGIVGTGLEINAFRDKVAFDKPTIYTVDMAGNPVTVTTTVAWNNNGTNNYNLSIGTYSANWPYIIEIDYGNSTAASPASINNLVHSTYYGGYSNEGIKIVDVDQATGNYVTVGETDQDLAPIIFPIISGSLVAVPTNTTSTWQLLTMVIFDKNGNRKAVNTYGIDGVMAPLGAVLNGNLVTVVGNNRPATSYNSPLPVINSPIPLTPGTYSFNSGPGYIVQFRYVPNGTAGSINGMTWSARLNGYASDIAKTPDGKYLYVSSSTNFGFSPIDTKTVSGAFNYNVINPLPGQVYSFQLWKFDSVGVRQWSTVFPALNRSYTRNTAFNMMHNNCNISLEQDNYVKCKIACDTYGFSIAGETDTIGLVKRNKYNVPIDTVFDSKTDAFFARFDKKDNLVYSTYVGGKQHDAFLDIAQANGKESIMVGYSNSDNYRKITTLPGGPYYVDSTVTSSNAKILIAKFDTLGNKTWATYWGTDYSAKDIVGWAVASDLDGKTYITGSEMGSNEYLPMANVYCTNVFSNSESFMLAFNDKMNYPIWSTEFGGKREDVGLSLAYNTQNASVIQVGICNTTYSTNTFEQPWFPITRDIFNPTAWFQPYINGVPPSQGVQLTYDGFISTFKTDMVVGIEQYFQDQTIEDAFSLFPNPTQNECSLAFKKELAGKTKIEVYDEVGRLVMLQEQSGVLAHSIINLNTSRLSNGIYIVKVSNNDFATSKKLIIGK